MIAFPPHLKQGRVKSLLLCFADAVAATGCGVADYDCQCTPSNNAAITSSVTPCLTKSDCTIQELNKVQQFGKTFCPAVRAATARSSSSTRSITAIASPRETLKTSITSRSSDGASATRVASPPTTTTSTPNLLGAGFPGTNWQPVHDSPNTNRGPAIEAVCITLFILAATVVAFRIYARLKTRKLRQVAQGLGWDEFFACLVLILVAGIVATVIVGVKHGMGKHQDHQTPAQIVKIIQVIYSFTLIIVLCFGALKISILCLYLRMTPERAHHITLYILIGFVALNTFAVFISNVFLCTPISDFWDLERIVATNMRCIDIIGMDIFTNAWSAFEDLIIWALPIPVLYSLKVPTGRKVGLYTLIGISFVAVACAITRASVFVIWIRSSDISWNFPMYPLLCVIESSVALITSSLPGIYPLFRQPAPEHRRSVALSPKEAEQQTWTSQGSTLASAKPGNGRSRWSFLSWHGNSEAVKKAPEQSMKFVPEGEPREASVEERPTTQCTMKAYVSLGEEAAPRHQYTGSHGRNISSEDAESLCYVGKAMDGGSSLSASSKEDDGLSEKMR
ncbi:MAG: hypothetical protein Q9169_002016 [Polycauliona sp. 2 TL-2023]